MFAFVGIMDENTVACFVALVVIGAVMGVIATGPTGLSDCWPGAIAGGLGGLLFAWFMFEDPNHELT